MALCYNNNNNNIIYNNYNHHRQNRLYQQTDMPTDNLSVFQFVRNGLLPNPWGTSVSCSSSCPDHFLWSSRTGGCGSGEAGKYDVVVRLQRIFTAKVVHTWD